MELNRGAEAVLIKKNSVLIKNRVKKGYRLAQIDEKIRKERTKKEAKLLSDAKRAGVKTPNIINVTENIIEMEFVNGKLLRDHLDSLKNWRKVCENIGKSVAKLHANDIIHGDLTTSNMILNGVETYFLDFGLGFESKRVEDKAVDLRVLEEALRAKHYLNHDKFFKSVLRGYELYEKSFEVINRLEKVRKRARYI
jgi:Kae1-associated kinase Bud32